MTAYGGNINLNGDDLTGEGDGDDEEIRVSLNLLPSNVKLFTVQINSYNGNSLKNVKSAYIRLSTNTDIIGTFSITQAGDNLGLLIGCFSKSNSNSWEFKPLNRVIPGRIVTQSVTSIQVILHEIFGNRLSNQAILRTLFENRLISAEEFLKRLMVVADGKSIYDTHWFDDGSNLIKSVINGSVVYNPEIYTFENKTSVVENINANGLILECNDISNDFNKLESGVPRLLHLKDNKGNGHVGVYLGKNLTSSKGNVNVIEYTTSWQANEVIYSWVDYDGTRRFYEGGPLSEMKYNWTSHASLDKWIDY